MSVLSELRQLEGDVGDLLAKHERAAGAQDFTKYADDPEGFYRDVLRAAPWQKQVEMAERVRDKPTDKTGVCVVTCNGLGKDWATAHMALWWVFARRGMAILTGPGERQVKYILMREVRKAFARAPELPGDLYAMELRVTDDCGILAFTSDNANKLVGYHHPCLLVCITEGQGVEDEAYEAAKSCCTGPSNRLFVYGNPTAPTGPFYSAATSEHWDTLTIAAHEHPNVITGREEIPGAVSREWIAMMRDEYGEASPIYQSRVEAKFPEGSVEGLLRRDWLRSAFARHESGTLEDEAARYPLILSVDVARFGGDSTVVSHVRGPVVEKLATWRGLSLTDTADRILAMERGANESVNPKWTRVHGGGARPEIVVDEPGLGGGLIDILKSKGARVVAFNGASKPIDDKRFLNTRAEAHWKFRELLENNRIALPRSATLEEEGLAVEWQLAQQGGTIQIVSKDTIRATLGRSPDTLDSVIIGITHSVGGLRRTARIFQYAL